jgi:hypothetical protein
MKKDPFSPEVIRETLATYETRLAEMERQLAWFEAQATTRQGRANYRAVQRAFARERVQIAKREAWLSGILRQEERRKRT